MSNNNDTELSDENLLKLMINQFNSWTNIRSDNVLIIKSFELFENSIVDKLENFLKKKLYHFPILYNKSKTNIENDENINKYSKLFKKYKLEIDKINNFPNNSNKKDIKLSFPLFTNIVNKNSKPIINTRKRFKIIFCNNKLN